MRKMILAGKSVTSLRALDHYLSWTRHWKHLQQDYSTTLVQKEFNHREDIN
jgi:hypothetical protein